MPRQVVVVAGVMVSRAAVEISQRPDNRQVMRLFGQVRKVLAQSMPAPR